jgi:hypothetical protein
MPIEIRELVIRASVAEEAALDASQLEAALARLKGQLVEECVGKIAERLANSGER